MIGSLRRTWVTQILFNCRKTEVRRYYWESLYSFQQKMVCMPRNYK